MKYTVFFSFFSSLKLALDNYFACYLFLRMVNFFFLLSAVPDERFFWLQAIETSVRLACAERKRQRIEFTK